MAPRVMTINGGSSSIKFALFEKRGLARRLLAGTIDRIGLPDATLSAREDDGQPPVHQSIAAPDHLQVVEELLAWLDGRVGLASLNAIGHRVVHGGSRFAKATVVTDELLDELRRLSAIDPNHLPGEIMLIEAFRQRFPEMLQVACFDTAFHHDMPRVAQILPVPRRFEAMGARRYGFHGLSYAYLMKQLKRLHADGGRIILAHLGNGASLAAVRDGQCIDTSMSFTPTAGLVMGTRTGDLDPGLLVYLMREEKLSIDALDDLINRQSGLLGVSETSSDMRDLQSRQANDPRAAEAVELFCYQAKKWLGAFAAALGGLDTVVFAGGIGEKSAQVRGRICEGLEFLGIRLDNAHNAEDAPIISPESSGVTVHVIPTDEESMIADEVFAALGK